MKCFCIIYLLILFLVGCNSDPRSKMLKTQSGQLTIGSAFLVETSGALPIGLTSAQIKSNWLKNNDLKSYLREKPFICDPIPYSTKLTGIYSRSHSPAGYPFFRYDYFKDTCISMWFVDNNSSLEHITGCIELFTKSYGNPSIKKVTQYSKATQYIWYHDGCSIILYSQDDQHGYQFDVIDSTKHEKAFQEIRKIGLEPDDE
jgi:hypothetical protein